jgi:hypothetical protein
LAAARAQSPVGRTSSIHPDPFVNAPSSIQLELELISLPVWSADVASVVLTSDYRLRMLEERDRLQRRYGVEPVDQAALRSSVMSRPPISQPQLNFVQELRLPDQRPLAGLQFETKDFLFKGDQLGVRSISDVEALARAMGLSGTAQGEILSMLGWRSHSRLQWQLGDPARELQWRFSAGVDRRASSQKSFVDFQLLRHF